MHMMRRTKMATQFVRQLGLAALGAALVTSAIGSAMGDETTEPQSTAPAIPLDEETWKLLTFGDRETVIVFAVSADGQVQAYKNENMPADPEGYFQEDLKIRGISLTIGGNTRVCWTTLGGDEQCQPPR